MNPCRTFAKSTYFLTELEPELRCPNDRPPYLHCLQIIPNCGPLWVHAVRAENHSDTLPTPHHSALGQQYDPRDCTPQPTVSPSPDPYFHNKLDPSPSSIIPLNRSFPFSNSFKNNTIQVDACTSYLKNQMIIRYRVKSMDGASHFALGAYFINPPDQHGEKQRV